MKQKIKTFIQYMGESRSRLAGLVIVLSGIVIYLASSIYMGAAKQSASVIDSVEGSQSDASVMDMENTAVVGEDVMNAASLGNSWPGEIISSAVSHIQPQREGVITSWRVRIGDAVSSGEVLGEVSAAPAMPELITMLAEKAEMASRSRAEAIIADEFAAKERERYDALSNAIKGNTASGADLSFTALDSMRKESDAMRDSVRSFIERALSNHILTLTNASSWQYYKYGSLNRQFGVNNTLVQNSYESALLRLVEKLKNSNDLPIEEAQNYFALAVSLANNSGDEQMERDFKMMAADNQMDFLKMISDYRMVQSKVANMETEYKIMIKEGGAMVEKDRLMAHAEADATEVAYSTIAREITGTSYIISPRSGTVSAIYKKAGDLVNPMMPIAVVAGYDGGNLTVRMQIPNNVRRPARGEIVSVVRPGFSKDIYKARITGIGSTLDDTGSYMADAVLIDRTDWSAGISVRVIAPQDSDASTVKLSSVWWDQSGVPHVWGVTEAGRVFARKVTIGRTLGSSVEIYEGLENGDRYVIHPTPDLREDMILPKSSPEESSGEEDSMGGMEM